jgi:hypothetical protein
MTGTEREQLSEALLDAFKTTEDLARFLQHKLGAQLNRRVNINAGMETQVEELIEWFDEERRTHELIVQAALAKPDNARIGVVADQVRAGGFPIPSSGASQSEPYLNPADDGFAQFCNRKTHWQEVKASALNAKSEIVFVPGGFERGHSYFMQRIKRQLKFEPKSVVEVGWPPAYTLPQTRDAFLELLGDAFDIPRAANESDRTRRVADALAARLSVGTVLLVHDTLSFRFEDAFRRYYTEWLPPVLRMARERGGLLKSLKCYQPIEWLDLPWSRRARASLSSLLGVPQRSSGQDAQSARTLMKSITAFAVKDVLEVRQISDLLDITEEDLIDLCRRAGIGDPDRDALLISCEAAASSNGKLKIIDSLMPTFTPIRKPQLNDEELD